MEEKMRQGLSLNEEHDKENIGGRIPHLKEIFPMLAKTMNRAANPRAWLIINNVEEDARDDHATHFASSSELLSNWRSEALFDVIAMK